MGKNWIFFLCLLAATLFGSIVTVDLAFSETGQNAQTGRTELHKAAHKGDISRVRELLKAPVDVDARDSFGGTALHAAMFQNNMDIVKLLLEHGFNPDAQGTSNGYTPLHDAVWAENLEAAKLLIRYGARLDIAAKDGLTPVQKAQDEGKKDMYVLLRNAAEQAPGR